MRSAGKVMAPVFWDEHRVIFIDYTEKRKTNMPLFLRSKEDIAYKQSQMKKMCSFATTSRSRTMVNLHKFYFKLFPLPPDSPELATNDYFLFANFKKMFARRRSGSSEEMMAETVGYFEVLDKSFYKKAMEIFER